MIIPWRLIGYLGGAAIVLGALFWVTHAVYEAGDKNGANRIQVAWDADKTQIANVAAQAIAQMTAERDMALRANEVIHDQYSKQLQANADTAAALSQRLRNAEAIATAHSNLLSKAADIVRSAQSGSTSGMGPIDDAIAAALTECADNRAQLNSLIAELKPQL